MTFPGNLLHGVLPTPPTERRAKRGGGGGKHRLTLMVGWWNEDGTAQLERRRRLGPCSPVPHASRTCRWPADLPLPSPVSPVSKQSRVTEAWASAEDSAVEVPPTEVAPVWEAVTPVEKTGAAGPKAKRRRVRGAEVAGDGDSDGGIDHESERDVSGADELDQHFFVRGFSSFRDNLGAR